MRLFVDCLQSVLGKLLLSLRHLCSLLTWTCQAIEPISITQVCADSGCHDDGCHDGPCRRCHACPKMLHALS